MFTYAKEIPVRYEADVFVAGGGPAGVAAALAAARGGARVFLAEQQGFFGGAGTAGLVPAFMPFTDGENFLAGGVGWEVFEGLTGQSELRHGSVPIRCEKLKLVYDGLMRDSGAKFLFHTTLIDAVKEGDRLAWAVLSGKSGLFAVKAEVFVDATGDGDLSALAGADFDMGDGDGLTMPATLCSLWAGIDFSRVSGRDNRELERAIADGVFKYEDRHLPGMFKVSQETGIGGGNIGHCFAVDATDEASLTEAMLRGREYIAEYEKYYKEYLTGYEKMELTATGAYLGVRESRRIRCDYTLGLEDFNKRADFPDEIGRFSYPVDIHIMTPDREAFEKFMSEHTGLRYEKGESYGIPYACLRVKGLSNLLTAGRCLGSDRHMQSSIRVMPACYITGQAAGAAAALACRARGDIRAVDTGALQKNLLGLGAYLPNA